MIPLLVILVVAAAYYFSFLVRVYKGLQNVHISPALRGWPLVSVIVAARNEESALGACLSSLVQQEYPKDRFEVIIVDDDSTDRTVEIAVSYARSNPNIRVVSLEANNADPSGRKPMAIAEGIGRATGEIILTTDADCVVPVRWIKTMAGSFDEGIAFVAGPVTEDHSDSLISRLSRLEFLGLVTTAAGLIGSGRPIICNGANIGYRKDVFLSADGFGTTGGFCDDETLMQRIRTRRLGEIRFCAHPDAIVTTGPPATLTDFWRQRVRWAAKKGHYEDKTILMTLYVLYSFFLSVSVAFGFLIFGWVGLLPALAVIVAAKSVLELFVLARGALMFRQSLSYPDFLVAEVFHVPYIVIAAFAGQFGSLNWKGRKLPR